MPAESVGERIRRCREWRGISREALAGLAGLSPTWLATVEQGLRPLERRFRIAALARALDMDVSALVASAVPPAASHRALPAVREAVLDGPEPDDPVDAEMPVAQLAATTRTLLETQHACRTDEVGAGLPRLLLALRWRVEHGPADDRDAALRLLALAAVQGAQSWLKDVGAGAELCWAAADLARRAAAELDDPAWIAFASFGTLHALAARGQHDRAARVGERAIADLARHGQPGEERQGPGDGPSEQLAGMLRLSLAYLAAARHRPADITEPLREATEIAARTGEGNEFWFSFGPANVEVWRLVVTLEAGDPGDAVRLAARQDPRAIPSPARRAAFHIEHGRALAQQRGREADAVAVLRTAERISPLRVRTNPLVADCVADLLRRRSRLGAPGAELSSLAGRLDLPLPDDGEGGGRHRGVPS